MAPQSHDSAFLNPNQRRSIEALLESVETTLYEIERLMPDTSKDETGVTSVTNDLPGAFGSRAPEKIARARKLIRALAERIELRRRSVSKRRAVRGMLSAQLVRLDDITPARLRSYGDVDPRFVSEISPSIVEIQGVIRTLLADLESG